MGKYNDGILGNFHGKIGPVVGASWKDIPYMRHKGRTSNKPSSPAQLTHQAKFGLVTKFVHKIGDVLLICYPPTSRSTGINQAFTDTFGKAITGTYPSFSLDYSKVLISKGELHNVNNPVAAAGGNGRVDFSWVDNSDGNMANKDDRAVLLVYCPELKQSIYDLSAADRQSATASLNVSNFSGKLVETWISFMTPNRKLVATSLYTGQLRA